MKKKCTSCNSEKAEVLYKVNDFPLFEGIINEEYSGAYRLCNLAFGVCKQCGTIFNLEREGVEFLENDYFRYYPCPTIKNTKMDSNCLELYHLADNYFRRQEKGAVYQDACQNGNLLRMFREDGWDTGGNELSSLLDNSIASELNIVRGSFRDAKIEKKFSAFISSHVLEHVDDTQTYLKKVADILRTNGQVVIQIPSLQNRMVNVGSFQFIACHASYFTESTLKNLFLRCGFRVDQIIHSTNNSAMSILAEFTGQTSFLFDDKDYRASRQVLSQYIKVESENNRRLSAFFRDNIHKNDRVIFYGAGGVLSYILYYNPWLVEIEHLIVDSSEYKWGKRILLSPEKIVSPENGVLFRATKIIVASGAFQSEILATCKKLYGESVPCITLVPEPKVS